MFSTKWWIAAIQAVKIPPTATSPVAWDFKSKDMDDPSNSPWVMPIYGMKLYGVCPGAKYRGKE